LTLVAGLTGIFVERLTAEAERRTEVVRAVAAELRENTRLLRDDRFSPNTPTTRQVYPRLVVSAVDLALVSGALGLRRDAELVGLLHRWRDTVHLFNRRLDLTEISTFSISPAQLEAFPPGAALREQLLRRHPRHARESPHPAPHRLTAQAVTPGHAASTGKSG